MKIENVKMEKFGRDGQALAGKTVCSRLYNIDLILFCDIFKQTIDFSIDFCDFYRMIVSVKNSFIYILKGKTV